MHAKHIQACSYFRSILRYFNIAILRHFTTFSNNFDQPRYAINKNPTQGMLGFIKAYLGWSITHMAQNYQMISISFISISRYCVQKYLVFNGPYGDTKELAHDTDVLA